MSALIALGLKLLGSVAPALADSIGRTYVQAKQTEAARQGAQDQQGTAFGTKWLDSVNQSNATRADVRKSEGAWGPMGIITFLIGLALVWHVWFIVADSSPFLLVLTMKFYVLPWPEWQAHKVGSWGVAALPGKFNDVELAVLQALFYVAPPAAAAIAVAKVFRR